MNNEFKKMQKLAGLINENQSKKILNESNFDTFNNVMIVINQLLEMGAEGERVLAILEKIPEWNELVSDNQDIDM
jgi:DNA-binding transcriptional regulator YhcF (GntR family)